MLEWDLVEYLIQTTIFAIVIARRSDFGRPSKIAGMLRSCRVVLSLRSCRVGDSALIGAVSCTSDTQSEFQIMQLVHSSVAWSKNSGGFHLTSFK
jgi:hypothetical protein